MRTGTLGLCTMTCLRPASVGARIAPRILAPQKRELRKDQPRRKSAQQNRQQQTNAQQSRGQVFNTAKDLQVRAAI